MHVNSAEGRISAGSDLQAAAVRSSSSPAGQDVDAFNRPTGESAQHGGTAPSTSLNERLKSLNVGSEVDYRPKHIVLGNIQSVFDAALSAYEQRLAPPAIILKQTFGFIYERRTASHPDSLAYVYESYRIGPITMCQAYKIVEHPYQVVREVGAVAGSAGIGGAVATNANSAVLRHDNGGAAEVDTVQFPCTAKSYTAVQRGSLTTPLPRRADFGASPVPLSSAQFVSPATSSPLPASSLAPSVPAAILTPAPAASLAP